MITLTVLWSLSVANWYNMWNTLSPVAMITPGKAFSCSSQNDCLASTAEEDPAEAEVDPEVFEVAASSS